MAREFDEVPEDYLRWMVEGRNEIREDVKESAPVLAGEAGVEWDARFAGGQSVGSASANWSYILRVASLTSATVAFRSSSVRGRPRRSAARHSSNASSMGWKRTSSMRPFSRKRAPYGSQEAIGFAEGPAVSASMLPSECSPAPCRASLPPDRQPCQSMQAPRLAPIHRNISEYVRYEIGNERTLTATAGRAAHYAVVGSARSSVPTTDASAPMNSARRFAGSASRMRSSTRLASGSTVRRTLRPSSVSFTA